MAAQGSKMVDMIPKLMPVIDMGVISLSLSLSLSFNPVALKTAEIWTILENPRWPPNQTKFEN